MQHLEIKTTDEFIMKSIQANGYELAICGVDYLCVNWSISDGVMLAVLVDKKIYEEIKESSNED